MKFTSFILLSASLALISGCGGGAAPAGDVSSGSSSGVLVSSEFYVGVGNPTVIRSHVRTAGSFGTSCSLPATSMSQDLVCYIDVPEGDLQFNGLTLSYNAPKNMCRYFTRRPYWFYNQEIGTGPTAIEINKTVNNLNVVSAYTCSINGGAPGACTGFSEIDIDSADSSVTCKYNLTNFGKKNCCFGEYTFTKRTTNSDTMLTTVDTEKVKWGGDMKACTGGAGRTNWELFTSSGTPSGVIEYAYDGLKADYVITAPVKSANDGYNISVANFYTPALHSHDGYVNARVTTLPYFLDPVDDRSGTLISAANPAYTFECKDEAYETTNRISVYVREWDVYTNYLAYIATAGVTEVPDRPGETEGVTCDGVGSDCNDRRDLDDFIVEVLGGPYDTATTANRRQNFPEQSYPD